MKHTKRLWAAIMAFTMVSAIAPISAFAITQADIDTDTGKATGTMTAIYDVQAKYTVTIPAGVELKSVGEGSVDKAITADDVMLESGQQIVVKLTGATNTESGSTFHAKATAAGSSSVATYTISKGETPVAVGDTVATFTSNADEQSETLTFSEASGATDAGEHTETLTFGIGTTKSLKIECYWVSTSGDHEADKDLTINYIDGSTWKQIVEMNDGLKIYGEGVCQSSPIVRLFNGDNQVKATDVFDTNANYVFLWEN